MCPERIRDRDASASGPAGLSGAVIGARLMTRRLADAPGMPHFKKTVCAQAVERTVQDDAAFAGGPNGENVRRVNSRGPRSISQAGPTRGSAAEGANAAESRHESHATALVEFVVERQQLFHDDQLDPYARDIGSGEVRRLDSRAFRDSFRAAFFYSTGKSASDQAVSEAIATLGGIARYTGELRPVFIRFARVGRDYILDLCEPGASRCVRLGSSAWLVEKTAPVAFVRHEPMQPLPVPEPGGRVDDLWKYVNATADVRLLVLAWLIEALRPDTPKPVLEMIGEQGSAKSTTQTILRRLIDPNAADLRALPKSPDDLFIAAQASAVLSFENVSHISGPVQDALCIIATSGAYAKRRLYTDGEEFVLRAQRPVILNGIVPAITQADLLDRAVSIELSPITDRREVTAILADFEAARPRLLGALLDLATKALALSPVIKLDPWTTPRMIEFARLGVAIAEALGRPGSEFLVQYDQARAEGVARTLDASPVASAIVAFIEANPVGGECKASEWSVRLRPAQVSDSWPRSPKAFGEALRRAVPVVHSMGIEVRAGDKTGGNIKWSIRARELFKHRPERPGCTAQAADAPPRYPGHSGNSSNESGIVGEPAEQSQINEKKSM